MDIYGSSPYKFFAWSICIVGVSILLHSCGGADDDEILVNGVQHLREECAQFKKITNVECTVGTVITIGPATTANEK